MQLQSFTGASEIAYGASVYLRCADDSVIGRPSHNCKSTSIRTFTAHLADCRVFSFKFSAFCAKSKAWTDSTIVLECLSAFPKRWTTFVANHESEIHPSVTSKLMVTCIDQTLPCGLCMKRREATQLIDKTMWRRRLVFVFSN